MRSSDAKLILRPVGGNKASVSRMDFTLRQLRVGRMQIFDHLDEENNQGAMTPLGLSLQVQLSAQGPSTSLVLQMKDVLSASACLQSVMPFLSLQLRHSASARLAAKLQLDKEDFDTRSKRQDERLFTIFFADQTRENMKDETWMQKLEFFLSNFKKCPLNLLAPDEACVYLDKAGAKVARLLHDAGHKIFKNEYDSALREFNRSTELGGEFIFLFSEQQLAIAQKLVSYYLDVKFESIDETFSETDPEEVLKMFDPRVWSKQDVMLEIAKHTACLKCIACGDFAKLKCSWCKCARYCGEACQASYREQHKEQCQELKEAARRQQEFYSHMAKEHFPCPGGLSFTKYNHRVTKRFNQLVRTISEQYSSGYYWKFKVDTIVSTCKDGPLMFGPI